ncbi:hypothetical protein IE81DRAFT_369447 [Ceraceosorus guamensis]|uniref:Secreted protein n=1 Tax=Ceraceosorus guamensis TaxID=1522189 RepID=A0A316VN42_9BASI|nr:hypothetical protein IE81DRAFT_369447 [Ceraceosorus guamensis]PWN38977.1 hypothetical protein IE81DRAFT_369447 [Ceraceosorus guamensis]
MKLLYLAWSHFILMACLMSSTMAVTNPVWHNLIAYPARSTADALRPLWEKGCQQVGGARSDLQTRDLTGYKVYCYTATGSDKTLTCALKLGWLAKE